jgi:hypothetical protein
MTARPILKAEAHLADGRTLVEEPSGQWRRGAQHCEVLEDERQDLIDVLVALRAQVHLYLVRVRVRVGVRVRVPPSVPG